MAVGVCHQGTYSGPCQPLGKHEKTTWHPSSCLLMQTGRLCPAVAAAINTSAPAACYRPLAARSLSAASVLFSALGCGISVPLQWVHRACNSETLAEHHHQPLTHQGKGTEERLCRMRHPLLPFSAASPHDSAPVLVTLPVHHILDHGRETLLLRLHHALHKAT